MGFDGGGLPVVLAAIHVLDRCEREFFNCRIVQASDVDCVKFAAKLGKRAALCKRPDTVPAAKEKREEGWLTKAPRFTRIGVGRAVRHDDPMRQ